VAACATSSLAAGTHPVTVHYAGNTDYTAGTSTALQQVMNAPVVTPIAPTVALTSSRNPATAGETVIFIAALSGSRGAPTGSVAFRDNGVAIAGCGAVALASGTATCATANLGVGTHPVTAHYAGNADYTAGASSAVQ